MDGGEYDVGDRWREQEEWMEWGLGLIRKIRKDNILKNK